MKTVDPDQLASDDLSPTLAYDKISASSQRVKM